MEVQNDNGSQNDILPGDGSATPEGTPGASDPGSSSIATQNGQPASGQAPQGVADPAEENKRLKGQITALQRQIIEARRSQGKPITQQNPNDPNAGQPSDEVGQKIAIAYEIADGQLRRQMENIYSLYPELPADMLSQIRRNPWAYCSRESFMQGDVETAKLEVEQFIADWVEGHGSATPPGPAIPSGKGVSPAPAPAPKTTPAEEAQQDWQMPMGDLEKKVAKLKQQRAA